MKPTLPILAGSLALAAALVPSGIAQGTPGSDDVSLPHRFTAGERAVADEVNENFDALSDAVESANGRLTDAEGRLDAVEVAQADLADTVAELPRRPANTIVVATEGGDFTSVVAALESITDAGPDNPYLVQVFPGVYEETELSNVREGVHLRGSGPSTTRIRVTRAANSPTEAAAAVRLFDGGRISNLGIDNDGATQISIGIIGFELTRSTIVDRVHALVDGNGGNGHFGMHVSDSDLVVRNSRLEATGATIVSSAFGSVDSGGPFAQPLVEDCELVGEDFGAQLVSTALTVRESLVEGDEGAISASVEGITRVENCHVVTFGLAPVYETSGSANILSASSQFQGGDPFGIASSFTYVHCYKSNFQPIANGTGSTVQ